MTTTFFENVTAISIAEPARYAPLAVDELALETTGITVSTVAVSAVLAVFKLPTASLNAPAST